MMNKSSIDAEFIPKLVSVIVPVYNREHLIADTLDSILTQTYREFEVIAINDGSKDESLLILNRYADQYPGVFRIIDQENTGQVVARNNGIKHAKGEYIAFLDSDDRWLPEKLAEQVPLFDQLDVGLVYSGITKIDENGQPFKEELCDPALTSDLYVNLLVRNQMTGGTVVVKRAALCKVGLFDETFLAAENWDLWLRVCRDFKPALVNKPLVQYRVHTQNMSKDRNLMILAKKAIVDKHCNQTPRNAKEAQYQNLAYADIDYCMGVQYFSNGEFREAKPHFLKALKRQPMYRDSLIRLLRCYLGKGNYLISGLRRALKS